MSKDEAPGNSRGLVYQQPGTIPLGPWGNKV